MTRAPAGRPDPVAARLGHLADQLEARLGSSTVRRHDDGAWVSIEPRSGACPVSWMHWGDEIIVGIGGGQCRWELDWSLESVAIIEGIVEAASSGRVTEVFGRAGSDVTIRRADGTIERGAQARAGCLPVRFWRRKGAHHVDYAPFD